jgi:hypothetical protein
MNCLKIDFSIKSFSVQNGAGKFKEIEIESIFDMSVEN